MMFAKIHNFSAAIIKEWFLDKEFSQCPDNAPRRQKGNLLVFVNIGEGLLVHKGGGQLSKYKAWDLNWDAELNPPNRSSLSWKMDSSISVK